MESFCSGRSDGVTLSRSDSVTLKPSSMLLVEGVRSSLMKSELEGISSEWCRNWVDIDTQRTRCQILVFIVKPLRCP
jgi:hypothetical protein